MDVLATASSTSGTAAAAQAVANAPAPPPIEASATPVGTPQAAPAPQPAAPSGSSSSAGAPEGTARGGIAPAIAKLFGNAAVPTPIPLNVSYRVARDPNEIVTVFTDPKTGQEIAQFPPEVLVGIAEFFDHNTGVTLDRDA